MKLFKSLLVAPATLGLLAPFTAYANEVNLNNISNYSDGEVEMVQDPFALVIQVEEKKDPPGLS